MNTINTFLTAWADWLISPFAGWPPILTLCLVSVLVGILMAVVFRFTSQQQALGRVVELSRAQVLAIKLFKDEPLAMFGSIGRLLWYSALRMWYSLPPVLVMIVPFVLLLVQLARWYEHYPLSPGDKAVVELQLAESAWPECRDVALEAPSQITVETGPLRDDNEHAIYWRIRAADAASAPVTIRWRLGSKQFDKQVALAGKTKAFGPVDIRRPGAAWWDRLLNPGESGFAADDPIKGVVVHHARRSTPLLGFDVPWWLTFLIVSILAAVLVRPLVKVNF